MASRAFNQPQTLQLTSASGRRAMLENLASLASVLVSERLEDFSIRLGDALLSMSEQTVRPAEASLSFNGFNYLRTKRSLFLSEVIAALGAQLAQQIQLLEKDGKAEARRDDLDLSLVTFDEMENKVLLSNIGQTLEHGIAETLDALGLRLAALLDRPELAAAQNPFRSQVFLEAVYHGWRQIDPEAESHKVMLRLLGPELFLPLDAILKELNGALVEQGILPDLANAYRRKKARTRVGMPEARSLEADPHYNKVRDWLLSGMKKSKADKDGEPEDLNVPDLFAPAGADGNWSPNTISAKVGPRLFGYLASMQVKLNALEAAQAAAGLSQIPSSASTLRQVRRHVPPGSLTQLDENTIELLARIFDHLFSQPDIPMPVRGLIGKLQLPLLKAALSDKKFFIKDDHPARQLVDKLVSSGMVLDQDKACDDPLYRMIEKIVERVQKEFDQQIGLFNDAAAELDAFLAEDENPAASQSMLADPIAAALREEKQKVAQQTAEKEVAKRIDTGEVAGFLETFLERHWTRILTLAFCIREQKPEVLQKALTTMDDLVWSVKPKATVQEKRELLTRLPAILAMVNAWLNAIKWDDPERVAFFSTLAERHAAIVRRQTELSSRQQVEMAVNIAQRASERRMKKRYHQTGPEVRDQWAAAIDELEPGDWIHFARPNGNPAKLRLAWVSPQRSRFIFASRQGQEPVTFGAEELAQSLRDKKAALVATESAVGRALSVVLEDQ